MDFSTLTTFLDALKGKRSIPSVDCAVSLQGQRVYRHSANAGQDDLYFLYSVSKVITCTAAAQLLERGKLLLTDEICEYLPEYRDMAVKHADGQLEEAQTRITVRHLFTMSAGLNYNLEAPSIQKAVQESGGRAPTREIARAIAQEPLDFEPGTHWQYSLCHDVLAALVEAVSQTRFADYVREHIFAPLSMENSTYHPTPEQFARIAPQFRYDDAAREAVPIPKAARHVLGPEYDSGGAGVVSCVSDMLAFAQALANGGTGANGARILSPRTVDLMRMNQLNEAQMRDFNWIQMAGYGYGLGVRTMVSPGAGRRAFRHWRIRLGRRCRFLYHDRSGSSPMRLLRATHAQQPGTLCASSPTQSDLSKRFLGGRHARPLPSHCMVREGCAMNGLFYGSGTALVTPFRDGKVDFAALGALIDWQISSGTDALVVLGTTGEPSTLSDAEREQIIAFAVERAAGRVPVIAGTGSNDTAKAIALARSAEAEGADALLVVTPYYNKAGDDGLIQHFTAIAERVQVPIIAYNVPSRTGVNLKPKSWWNWQSTRASAASRRPAAICARSRSCAAWRAMGCIFMRGMTRTPSACSRWVGRA